MTTQEIVSIILAVGFLIIVACIILVTFYFIKVLKSAADIANSVQDTTQNIKEKLQTRAWTIIPALLLAIIRGIIKRRR